MLHRCLPDARGLPNDLFRPLLVRPSLFIGHLQRHNGVLLRGPLGREAHQKAVPRAVSEQDVGGLPRECHVHASICVGVLRVLEPEEDDGVRTRKIIFRTSAARLHAGDHVRAAAACCLGGGPAPVVPNHPSGASSCCSGLPFPGIDEGVRRAIPRAFAWDVCLLHRPLRWVLGERYQARLWHQGFRSGNPRPWGLDGSFRLPVCHGHVHVRAPHDILPSPGTAISRRASGGRGAVEAGGAFRVQDASACPRTAIGTAAAARVVRGTS
mmetsp:Transcript_6325/g.15767  ORF Transcript_6325/g.15767 Transcript_6325/m.15767 type:complete len:268 (+) Transcript_6325:620-1423(+)